MWLSLAIALLTYLLSPRDTAKERRQALLNAGVAGGATYLATEYTSWGSDVSDKFDSVIGVEEQTVVTGTDGETVDQIKLGSVGGSVKADGKPWWSAFESWGPAATAVVAGGAGVALGSGSVPTALWVIGAVAIGFLLLR